MGLGCWALWYAPSLYAIKTCGNIVTDEACRRNRDTPHSERAAVNMATMTLQIRMKMQLKMQQKSVVWEEAYEEGRR